MKFPKTVKHGKGRNTAEVVIYGKTSSYPRYRLAFYESGGRVIQSFGTYSDALEAATDKAKELAGTGKAPALTKAQTSDAKAAYEVMDDHYKVGGKRVSLLVLTKEYAAAMRKLGDRPLSEAVEGFLSTVATIQRKPLSEAVEEFIAGRQSKTEAKDGRRPQLNLVYARNVANWLNEFADTIQNTAVCDLGKVHLDAWISSRDDIGPKARNDRRAATRMFLKWCVTKDFLAPSHRLFEAEGLKRETVEIETIDFYRPKELRSMIEQSSENLLPVIALGGLAGLRLAEILRLTWEDVWRTPGHVEVTAAKSKTRSRRLIEMVPALSAWLAPYAQRTGPLWALSDDSFQIEMEALCTKLEIPKRRNGLRHGFVTYHFAMHQNENLTSAMAGNSPAMIHQHYKGLAVKTEAERWFAVAPAQAGNVIPMATAAKA